MEFKDQLKIHYDPWDVYLHHDSKYFLELLFNNHYRSQLETAVITRFVLNQHQKGLFPFYDLPASEMLKELFQFA